MKNMARAVLPLILLALGVARGFELQSARDYLSRLFQKAPPHVPPVHICEMDGMFPNPDDCATYVMCRGGVSSVLPCFEDLHFDVESGVCQEPCMARCDPNLADECGWDESLGSLSSPPDVCSLPRFKGPCDAYQVRHYYDSSDGQCKKFIFGGCRSNGNNFRTKEECLKTCAQTPDSTEKSATDFHCHRDGLFRNLDDCGTFIQCSNGRAYVMDCPEGLHFDQEAEQCRSPCDARCDPHIADRCRWDTKSSRKYPPIPRRHSLGQSTPGFHCVRNGVYRNPGDCGTFIQCSEGRSYVMPCPEGLHFDQESERCLLPCDAKCDPTIANECGWGEVTTSDFWQGERSAWEPTDDSWKDYQTYVKKFWSHSRDEETIWPDSIEYTTHSNEDSPTEDSWSATEADTEYPKMKLEFSCVRNGLYPNRDDCGFFIQCANGQPFLMKCPKGLHFSIKTKTCDYPCEAQCDPDMACNCHWPECGNHVIVPDCVSVPEPGPCEAAIRRYYYDYESGRCRSFIYGGCDGNGNNYRTLEECAKTCQRRLLNDFRCPSNTGNFGHYPDCLSYYACKRGVPYLKRCPKGTAFHHKKAKCVPEHEAVCVFQCPDSDAVYPMDNDCRQYIDCVNGISRVESCPLNQAFDPRVRDCVDEAIVACPLR